MDGALLASQAHRLDRQALHAPDEGPIKERMKQEVAALHRALDAVPTPTQMDNIWQRRACQTPLMMDQLAGEHGDEHNANEVSSARRQRANQVVDDTGCQVNWVSAATMLAGTARLARWQ